MNPTLRYYLGEVLGVDLVPKESLTPPAAPAAPLKFELINVLSFHKLSHEENALLKKMMQAIGVSDYRVTETALPGPGAGLVFGNSSADSMGLNQLGATVDVEGRRWIRTYSLNDMLTGSEGEIQSRKRTAWAHLQLIRSWLKESAH